MNLKIKTIPVSLILSLSMIFSVMDALAGGVAAVPNKAGLRGTVLGYCVISSSLEGIRPEQALYKLTISIEETEDIKNYPNFLRDKEGQSITFYSKEKQPLELYGRKIKAIIEYKGDEKGGRFWIKQIKIAD